MRSFGIRHCAVVFGLFFFASAAGASPRTLPFTYPYQTLPKGELEIEIFSDISPVRALSSSTGGRVWAAPLTLTSEFEFGLTDRLELGLYLQIVPHVSQRYATVGMNPDGNAIKQRLRYRFAEAGEWPIDLSIYGEISEGENAIELEAKINLQRRIGPVLLLANLWGEREYYYDGTADWVLNPVGGASYEIAPWAHVGVEYWMRAEFSNRGSGAFGLGPHHFIGPTCMFSLGGFWTSLGVYARVSDVTRSPLPGDFPGPIWIRSVIGIEMPE